MTDCENCGESFPDDELNISFFWVVCDKCRDDHDAYEAAEDPLSWRMQ